MLQIRHDPYPWSRATPSLLLQGLRFPGVLLLGMCLLGSCARSPKPVSDVPPEPVPATASSSTEAPHVKAAQDLQSQGKSSSAIRILQSFLDSQPDRPLFLETQIALARIYEQSGDLDAALQTYRDVMKHAPSPSSKNFKQQARERIAFLEARTKPTPTTRRSVSVMVSAASLPPRDQWESWLEELQQAEVTILILEVGTKPVRGEQLSQPRPAASTASGNSPAVYFQTTWAPVKKPVLNQIVPVAHKNGIAVFGAVTLRRMPWLEPPVGWADWVYRLDANRLERSQALDIFNPAVQDYHAGFLSDLAKTGIDGVFFRADAPMGPFEGLTRFGLKGFRREHGVQLNARILFPPRPEASGPSRSKSSSPHDSAPVGITSRFSPAYWKWEGWKVREQLRVLGRYITTLRKQVPGLQFAIEVHAEAISKPIEAMVHYSEDVLEAKQLGIHYLVTPLGAAGRGPVRLSDQIGRGSKNGGMPEANFMTQALEVMESSDQIWIKRNLPQGQVSTIGQIIPVRMDQLPFPKGVGLLYTLGRPVLP